MKKTVLEIGTHIIQENVSLHWTSNSIVNITAIAFNNIDSLIMITCTHIVTVV